MVGVDDILLVEECTDTTVLMGYRPLSPDCVVTQVGVRFFSVISVIISIPFDCKQKFVLAFFVGQFAETKNSLNDKFLGIL